MYILLGLLQGSYGVVTQLIENQGADVNKIREHVSYNAVIWSFWFDLERIEK